MEIRRYRFAMTALLISIIIHVAALLAAVVLIQPGLDLNASIGGRATYVAEHPLVWRIGWATWQAAAASDLLLSVALLLWTAKIPGRRGFGWAVTGLLMTLIAIGPEQYAEALIVTRQVELAGALGPRGDLIPYFNIERSTLWLTATWGNTFYTLMGVCWMFTLTRAAGGGDRCRPFVFCGFLIWGLFAGSSLVNHLSTTTADITTGYPGSRVLFAMNALAFPALIIWMIWMAVVMGWGHHERYPASDARLHELRWPGGGLCAVLARLVSSPGLKDLVRMMQVVLPLPVLRSDITDVVYLNWLVPAKRLEGTLPAPLRFDRFGERTFISLLTYRHGHFGPALSGPLRAVCPSPCQSNWRFYTEPEYPGAPRDAIYFVKTSLDHSLMVLCSRLLTDGLPSQRPARLVHGRDGASYVTRLEPGGGSAPDLVCRLTEADTRELPESMKEHFADWPSAVKYLIEQNRAVSVLPAHGRCRESRIEIPISLDEVIPLQLEGELKSRFLADWISDCELLAFVVPSVSFRAVGEAWTAPIPTGT